MMLFMMRTFENLERQGKSSVGVCDTLAMT